MPEETEQPDSGPVTPDNEALDQDALDQMLADSQDNDVDQLESMLEGLDDPAERGHRNVRS